MLKLTTVWNTKSNPLLYVLGVLVLLVSLEIICLTTDIPDYLLPAPSKVISYLITNIGGYSTHILTTLEEIAAGFLIGWTVAFILALVVTLMPATNIIFRPIIIISQTIPIIAIAPIIILWFGFGILSKMMISALLVLFPVFVGISDGLHNVPEELLDIMSATRAKRFDILRLIRLPNAVPQMITSTKIGITLSVIGAIIGEFITAEHGIGLLIRKGTSELNSLMSFGMLYILGFIGIVLYSILDALSIILEIKYRKIT